jgi:hypothetical protein
MDLCHPESLVYMVVNRFQCKSLNREAVLLLQLISQHKIYSCLQCRYDENQFIVPFPDPSSDSMRCD